jgi:hypothetical protein
MAGSSSASELPVYGTIGVASNTTTPGALDGAVTWSDPVNSNLLWLFGGSLSTGSYPNALWMWDGTYWTCVNRGTTNGVPSYGVQGVANSTNIPGGRYGSASWRVGSTFWMFGGYGMTTSTGFMNDLWKYEGGLWTWVAGNSTLATGASFGIQGVPSPSNFPPARWKPGFAADNRGNLWLFGGSTTNNADFSDLWKFDTSNGMWTWVHGSNGTDSLGFYGTPGVFSFNNGPPARRLPSSWSDASGNFWMYAGLLYDPATGVYYEDMWVWNGAGWAWVDGSSGTTSRDANYGTIGVFYDSTVHYPGGRANLHGWTVPPSVSDAPFWIYGGSRPGISSRGDLWNYRPSGTLATTGQALATTGQTPGTTGPTPTTGQTPRTTGPTPTTGQTPGTTGQPPATTSATSSTESITIGVTVTGLGTRGVSSTTAISDNPTTSTVFSTRGNSDTTTTEGAASGAERLLASLITAVLILVVCF